MQANLVLNFLDIAIIAAYFVGVFALAIFITNRGKFKSSDEYFLAGRNIGWFLVGASLFATNIGSEHLIGLAGTGASSGVAVAQFEILACFILLLLGWFFVPFYIRTSVATMPEFLEMRYSKAARNYLTFISIIAYVLVKISVTIYAGAIVFESIGVPFWIGGFAVVAITGLYTIMGGLRAVIYTDAMQMFVMLIGALAITFFGISKLGGFGAVQQNLSPVYYTMWENPDFPWTGILFGAPILGVWYWCTDQVVVQRTLSALNIQEARRGSIFAGYLKILPLFIFVFPGMICMALANAGHFELVKKDLALPTLAANVLPVGFKGFFIAGLLAALMSSLASVLNSCSTLITYDVFKQYFPKASEKKLIRIGRLSTGLLVILGVLWIPLMSLVAGEMYKYIQSVQAYISPPVAAVFLVGILWRRINSKGAMAAMYSGLLLGLSRLVLEITKPAWLKDCSFMNSFTNMNFLHFALCLFIFSVSLMVIVSLVTQPDKKNINQLTVDWQKVKKFKWKKVPKWAVGASVLLALIVFAIWWIYK